MPARARPAAALLLVALVGALFVLPRLGHRQVLGTHEAVFPLVARDIVARQAWLGAELRGHPYRNKPPVYPWAIALFSWPAGVVTEVSARLPGALAAIGTAVLTCMLGARLFGTRVGLWSALMLLTSVVFFDQATATIPDLPMVFFDLLAGLALWSLGNEGGRRAALVFYFALALAVATKGIPGLLPLAIALAWLPIGGGARRLRRLLWLPGIVVFAVVTALWLVPYATRGRDFAGEVVWRDWLRGPLGVPEPTTLGHQLTILALALLPWAVVLPLAIVAAVRARHSRRVAFALCWLIVQGALILVIQQQRLRYLLPLLPGAALLVAWWADREALVLRSRPVLAALAIVGAIAAPIALPAALRAFELDAVATRSEIAIVAGGIALVGVVAAAALWNGRMTITVPAVVIATAAVLLVSGWIVDGWANRAWDYRRAASDLRALTRPLAAVALVDDHELLPVDFYLGRALPALRSPDAVLAHLASGGAVVVDRDRWRSAREWPRFDPDAVRAEPLSADLLLVSRRSP